MTARILFLVHVGEKDAAGARALQTSVSTVERTRKNLMLESLKAALRAEVNSWQAVRNAGQARLYQAFRLEDARQKLKRLNPAPSA